MTIPPLLIPSEMPAAPERIGEIIEASTTQFIAGSYELLETPPFGSMVRAQARNPQIGVYGLIYQISTGSREPGGRAIVRGRTYTGRELYDDQIYAAHPDLAEVLQTEFAAITVGFCEAGQIYHYLPAHPPPVHYSVYPCSIAEQITFSNQFDFLRGILFAPNLPSDELTAAAIRTFAHVRQAQCGDCEGYLLDVGRELARLLKDDYDRLSALLRRIRPAGQ